MARKLNARQEAFANAVVLNGGDKVKARAEAGYSMRMSKASQGVDADKLYNHAGVNARIKQLTPSEGDKIRGFDSQMLSELEFLRDENKRLKSALGVSGSNRSPSKSNRYAIMLRAGFKCQCCGDSPSRCSDVVLHVDHVKPFSVGGDNSYENLQVLCHRCNMSKSNFFNVDHNEGWQE